MKKIPEVWVMSTDEVSAGVYRLILKANDGRAIEATGTDLEALKEEVMRSLATLDISATQRPIQ